MYYANIHLKEVCTSIFHWEEIYCENFEENLLFERSFKSVFSRNNSKERNKTLESTTFRRIYENVEVLKDKKRTKNRSIVNHFRSFFHKKTML